MSGSAVASSSPAPATTPLFGSLFSNNNNINNSSNNSSKPLDSVSNKSVQGSVAVASEKNAATNNSNNFNNQLFGAGRDSGKSEPVVELNTPSFANRERSGALFS